MISIYRDMLPRHTHTTEKSLVRRRCRVYIKNRHYRIIVITTVCVEGSKRLRVHNKYTCSDVVLHNHRAMIFRSVCSIRFFTFCFAVVVAHTSGAHRYASVRSARFRPKVGGQRPFRGHR